MSPSKKINVDHLCDALGDFHDSLNSFDERIATVEEIRSFLAADLEDEFSFNEKNLIEFVEQLKAIRAARSDEDAS
jgi:hypothetical protein